MEAERHTAQEKLLKALSKELMMQQDQEDINT